MASDATHAMMFQMIDRRLDAGMQPTSLFEGRFRLPSVVLLIETTFLQQRVCGSKTEKIFSSCGIFSLFNSRRVT